MTTDTALTDQEKEHVLSADPFDGDFGEQDDIIFSDRIGFARKAGACSFCQAEINPGDQQRRMSAKFDGEMRSYRWCLKCCRKELGDHHDH